MKNQKLKDLFGIHAAEAPLGGITDSRNWINPEEIKRHKYGSSFIPEKLSCDAEKARRTIEGLKAIQEKNLKNEFTRYDRLRFGGSEEVSSHDINICSSGNAAKALHSALQLKFNHITYSVSQIAEFNDYLNGQLEGHTIQMGLF